MLQSNSYDESGEYIIYFQTPNEETVKTGISVKFVFSCLIILYRI